MESKWTIQALKEHFDTVLQEQKSLDIERADKVQKQFEGQQKLYETVQNLSNIAISKQEASQNQYNIGHNDLTRKMESQYKEMLPRTEADSRFKNIEDKLNDLTGRLDVIAGRGTGVKDFRDWIPWVITVLLFLYMIYSKGAK